MKHLGVVLLAICLLLLLLMLALAMLLQAGATLAATLNVSGLVCLLALLLPCALAGAAAAGYAYAHVQARRRRAPTQSSAAQGPAMLPGNPPTVFVVRPRQQAQAQYPASPRLLTRPVRQSTYHPHPTRAATSPMLASIYGFGSADTAEGREDED